MRTSLRLRMLLGCSLLALSITTLGSVPNSVRAQDPPKGMKLELADGKLSLSTPDGWKKSEPKSSMIQYEFRAPFDAKEDQQARVTVMSAGGGIEANIKRWKDQFDLTKDSVDVKEIEGQKVHMVDLQGTFKESMGGPVAGGPTKKLADYRMLGLIIESKTAGTVFFKMTGPQETVAKQVDAWKKMAESLKVK